MAADRNITEEDLDETTRFFYITGSADKALLALQYFIDSDLLSNAIETGPYGPMPYFFYRAAQIYTELWPKYMALFESASQKQRLFILSIFALGNNEKTDKYLTAWRENKDYEELHNQIDALLRLEGRGKNAIEIKQISTGRDLDLLWGEFLITGNKNAILRIIDVLDWPDLIRERLEESLKQRMDAPLHPSPSEFREQLLNQGIILDNTCSSIYSAQDLDCFCVMEGCEISKDRLDSMKHIFPFDLSDSDLTYIGLKASAKWSLCSNAIQHEVVLGTCIDDNHKRSGECRLSLLEIIAHSYLATDDLENGLNYFYESLSLDPDTRDGQKERAQETYNKLLLLDINGEKQVIETQPDHELIIKECLNACESLHSYHAKMIWREQPEDPTQHSEIFWEAEHVKPDLFRVTQIAGDDSDEWITIGNLHYRGPLFTLMQDSTLVESDLMFNHALTMENYLNVVREVRPDEIHTHTVEQVDFVALDYKLLDISRFTFLQNNEGNFELPLMRLWVDAGTKHLVKTEMLVSMANNNKENGTLNVVHLFTGHNDSISIFPPPFDIVQFNEGIDEEQGLPPSRAQWKRQINQAEDPLALLKGQAPLSLPWHLYIVLMPIAYFINLIPIVQESTAIGLIVDSASFLLLAFIFISIWRCAWNTDWKGWGYISRTAVVLITALIVYEWITT